MTNKEFAQMLRALDIYEQNEGIEQPYTLNGEGGPELIFSMNRETFAATVKAFGGGDKAVSEDWLIFRPTRFPTIAIHGYRRNICERIVTGTKRVEERIIPATEEQTIPAHDEEIVEYRCEPFLAEAKV